MGTWSFRARLGGNYARTCVHARARRRWRRRPAGAGLGPGFWVRVRVPYPAWFFLNRVCGYGLRAYRSATRTGPAPLSGSEPTRQRTRSKTVGMPTVATVGLPTVVTVGCVSWAANSCDCWVERLQPFVGFGPVGPSWSAINSAPDSQLKTHQKHQQ